MRLQAQLQEIQPGYAELFLCQPDIFSRHFLALWTDQHSADNTKSLLTWTVLAKVLISSSVLCEGSAAGCGPAKAGSDQDQQQALSHDTGSPLPQPNTKPAEISALTVAPVNQLPPYRRRRFGARRMHPSALRLLCMLSLNWWWVAS